MAGFRRFELLWVLLPFLTPTPLPLSQAQRQSRSPIPELHLNFTTVDVPGAGFTGAWGINSAGDIVGNYGENTNGPSHGFRYSNGAFTYFDYPGETETVPRGIDDSGLIVGYAGDLAVVGFVFDGISFTSIRHGSDGATFTEGINNAGILVGGTGTVGTTSGFELHGQRFRKISPPPGGWIYVYATAINNLGEVVGWTSGATDSGFAYKDGRFQTINVPGANGITQALGVNDSGVVVGLYERCDPCAIYGFAMKNGRFSSFSYPGAVATAALGVNAHGQVVGQYQLPDSTFHGFVTSPITDSDLQ